LISSIIIKALRAMYSKLEGKDTDADFTQSLGTQVDSTISNSAELYSALVIHENDLPRRTETVEEV
jgi:hypothetical protein